MAKRKALITGITGQDGSYLAELLLEKGYEVHGIVRRVALEDPEHRMVRIYHLMNQIELHSASIESFPSIYRAIQIVKPDECYHLAAQSFVSYSFEDEYATFNTNINGTHHLLSALRELTPQCRFYFAASSEVFGRTNESPQNENTVFHPRSVYGISKIAGFDLTRNYRETYGLHASSGILYNHESPRRGYEYVTRKITHQAAKIKFRKEKELRLGNLASRRDWGHAKDYVRAMWLILQQNEPDDYVVATGIVHSVEEFVKKSFDLAGLDYTKHVVVDNKFLRPEEGKLLVGDAAKARRKLGWAPEISFDDMIKEMVEEDIKAEQKDLLKK